MQTKVAGFALAAMALAACSGQPAGWPSSLVSRFSLASASEHLVNPRDEIDCGSPGGGGGYQGAGPHDEPLAYHHAFISCEYAEGSLDQLSGAWGVAGTAYLESAGVDIADPGSFTGENLRGFTWEYTSGDATGVLTITIVPAGDTSYTVVGDLVEFVP